jgi:hypothetical protein
MKVTKHQFNELYHSCFCLFKLKACDGIQWPDVLKLVINLKLCDSRDFFNKKSIKVKLSLGEVGIEP